MTCFCSGRRSITGYAVSGSISVLLAPSIPSTSRAILDGGDLEAQAHPRNGILFSLAKRAVMILPSMPRFPKPPGMRMPSTFSQLVGDAVLLDHLGVHEKQLDLGPELRSGVMERLQMADVGIGQVGVLADAGDADRLVGIDDPVQELLPLDQVLALGDSSPKRFRM